MDYSSVFRTVLSCIVGVLAITSVNSVVNGQRTLGDLSTNRALLTRWRPASMMPMRMSLQPMPIVAMEDPVVVDNRPVKSVFPEETQIRDAEELSGNPESPPTAAQDVEMSAAGRKRSSAVMCYINPISCFGRYPARRAHYY